MKHDFVKEKGGVAMRQGVAKFTGAWWMMVATVLLFVGGKRPLYGVLPC
jgi:hypothetical protein